MSQTTARSAYLRVQDSIRERVRSGEWKAGSRIPTERELEKELQISRLTISKGLSHLVADGLLVRKRGQGTFIAEAAKSVKAQARLVKYIGPIPPREWAVIRPGILEGMHEVLAQRDYHVGIDLYRNSAEHVALLRRDDDAYHAGFVVWNEPSDEVHAELRRLRDQGYPFVLTDSYPDDLDIDCVFTDLVEASRMVVRRLATSGHKRIVYVAGRIDRNSLENRLAGFIGGMISCGLPVREDSVVMLNRVYEQAEGELGPALEQILSRPDRPTALYFSHANLAIDAAKFLRDRGVRIPQDISLIGNDVVDPSMCPSLQLATVVQDFFNMGVVAGQILLNRLENLVHLQPVRVAIKPKLVDRDSIGPVTQ